MKSSWLEKLAQFVERSPIILLRFDESEWTTLSESRRGISEFTIALSHSLLQGVKVPTPCIIRGVTDGRQAIYFGLVSSRSAVTTLETRIKLSRVVKIRPESEPELAALLKEHRHARNLRTRLLGRNRVVALSPKLSRKVIEGLASLRPNRGAMRSVSEALRAPKYFRDNATLQQDAVQTALRAFGLTSEDRAQSLELVEGRESSLAHIYVMEDSVIEHDARYVPGYELVSSDITGRAIFERGVERLEIYTANRRPLEKVFGVDLIYLNVARQNLVMLQYKMLEPLRNEAVTDWIYRPDAKLTDELRRMRRFAAKHGAGLHEYRLNPSMFYLKFVKRNAAIRAGGIITPIDHYEKLRDDPALQGPRKALRISYEALSGRYLREHAFLDLIRSGYIGAHAKTTAQLKILIEGALKRDRAVVAAIQRIKDNTIAVDDSTDESID